MSKRTVLILVLLAVVSFYALGTGFAFFYKFMYALLLLLAVGLIWSWSNLRGIEVFLQRTSNRGQVGGTLEGRVRVVNKTIIPKSWLEVLEYSDLPGHSPGRGVAMIREQTRAWTTQTYLSRRGIYHTGQIEVISHDPFGMFRLKRRFLESQEFIVLPATEPLPDLNLRFANLPSDSRIHRSWDQITTDVASVREYVQGDSFRRIHWPSTARKNSLMVKEFDIGLSAEAWVLLDMDQNVHAGIEADEVDNTEEFAVATAASIIARLAELSLPVGLATSGDRTHFLRPDSSIEHQGRLLEILATVRAQGSTPLERFIYEMRPQLSRFNTVTIITPCPRLDVIAALNDLRRQGVGVSMVLVDPQGYGSEADVEPLAKALISNEFPAYVVQRGRSINDSLRESAGGNAAAQQPAAVESS